MIDEVFPSANERKPRRKRKYRSLTEDRKKRKNTMRNKRRGEDRDTFMQVTVRHVASRLQVLSDRELRRLILPQHETDHKSTLIPCAKQSNLIQ